eukprot:4668913-Prymnesium_polylepis.1
MKSENCTCSTCLQYCLCLFVASAPNLWPCHGDSAQTPSHVLAFGRLPWFYVPVSEAMLRKQLQVQRAFFTPSRPVRLWLLDLWPCACLPIF